MYIGKCRKVNNQTTKQPNNQTDKQIGIEIDVSRSYISK
ncbi:hypothetical protein LSA2311_orf00179 [Staphylococcus phage LSA2311]|nr:hypothetical protein LSA2311_orf00179 [Staphylococcus phage LSA2311]